MFARTNLVKVQGIASSYDSSNPSAKIDISKLTNICFLTPDAAYALRELDAQVRNHGGCLYVSDMFRSWAMQKKAHDDWITKKRKDYAAPPGESFHMAGRAIDIDVQHLSFACAQQDWLKLFWQIAIPIGWRPIVPRPDAGLSESWHFQFVGKDWQYLASRVSDGQVAKCAILDAGQWDVSDSLLAALFLQAQCNRLLERQKGASALFLDGKVGPVTRKVVDLLIQQSWTIESAIQKLVSL